MSENPLKLLGSLDQSVWYDNIHRDMLQAGELERMVAEDGLTGVTSNPTIFEKAITGSKAYDEAIASAVAEHPEWDTEELFNHLAVADIQAGADILRPVYDATDARDGMISIEVSPTLAHDTEGTVREARKLHAWVDRPNVMIKVPATVEGLPAIETLISEGIHVNVTLLFSLERYREVVEAYIRGLEQRLRAGKPVSGIASVASFFVSRVDSAVDKQVAAGDHAPLAGKAAIANARIAYKHFLNVFDGDRFQALREQGAQVQRLLWASTGTKNPAYSDVLYVEELIAERTVTTLPPATYDAYKDHGEPKARLVAGIEAAETTLQQLSRAGVDLAAVTKALEVQGVEAFVESYRNLLSALEEKRAAISTREAAS
ncbi:transaldolase [Alkalilimnicola ehrlichii]|uniref:Transaldolase n=1 Tax=Alkalilimnicola ehrlichii TaxID=351052 RepID=A0A3E0X409_9GAMM|nr:transaldolase [Alkalilimnicola ehrlichii]RFA31271.1 transaldolase [Alkalilimnicola ehrlichii]RFA39454.1 transaldolase [Alkalilimnicola ehrlichii]